MLASDDISAPDHHFGDCASGILQQQRNAIGNIVERRAQLVVPGYTCDEHRMDGVRGGVQQPVAPHPKQVHSLFSSPRCRFRHSFGSRRRCVEPILPLLLKVRDLLVHGSHSTPM
jgi:hypothetical protein